MRIEWASGTALGLALLLGGVRSAQGATEDAIPLESDTPRDNVTLGVRVGPGFLYAAFDDANTSGQARMWGQAGSVGVWAGWSITPKLVVAAEFDKAHVFVPSSGSSDRMEWLDLSGVGPSAKYYLTSDNVYVAASLLLSRFSFQGGGYRNNTEQISHWGGAARLAAGKEWQLSPSWYVGLEGAALLGWMDYDPGGPNVLVAAKGAFLSASIAYNGHRDQAYGSDIATRTDADVRVAVGRPPVNRSPTPGHHTHDGLYVGVRAGVGRLRNPAFGDRDYGVLEGRDWQMALAVGAAITRHVILFGELSESKVRQSDGTPVDFSLVVAGPGVTYYLEPSNLFVSGAFGWAGFGSTRAWEHSGQGIAARLSLGKEWWVSGNWGLGLAVEGLLADLSFGSVSGLSLQGVASFN